MTLGSGDVKDFVITPSAPPDPERVPVTEAHLRGVTDPMTGSLMRVPGTGNALGPQACQRPAQIFDGRMRYTLKFAYKRMEQVKAEKGYQGPVVVCAVTFVPLAGYIPSRAVLKYLVEQREMETWLAPIAGTRLLVPFRMSIPTPLGHRGLAGHAIHVSGATAARGHRKDPVSATPRCAGRVRGPLIHRLIPSAGQRKS